MKRRKYIWSVSLAIMLGVAPVVGSHLSSAFAKPVLEANGGAPVPNPIPIPIPILS
jgi:hypothetical protein